MRTDTTTARVPRIASIAAAVELATLPRLNTAEIRRLFGCGANKAGTLKRAVREEMLSRGMLPYDAMTVDTAVAFEVWGIDAGELRRKLERRAEIDMEIEKGEGI